MVKPETKNLGKLKKPIIIATERNYNDKYKNKSKNCINKKTDTGNLHPEYASHPEYATFL